MSLSSLDSEQPVRMLPGVGPALSARLARLGINQVSDLLWHLPRKWIDLTDPQPIQTLQRDQPAVVQATVRTPRVERTSHRGVVIFKAELEDKAGDRLTAVWFNQPFLARILTDGSQWLFWGTPKFEFQSRTLQWPSPRYTREPAVLPVYPETDGLTSARLRQLIHPILPTLELEEFLPTELRAATELPTRTEALRTLHAPTSAESLTPARTRLALDELIRLFLVLTARRAARDADVAPVIEAPIPTLKAFVAQLPFRLTDAQRRASWQLLQDLNRSTPMARLLLGDVGSGKTIVALIGAYAALKAGQRVVWLTPTQLLAEQHLATVQRFLPTDVAPPALLTATKRPDHISQERFLIGTHALLNQTGQIGDLGLVIIDEQHRFGVKQRQALLTGAHQHRPHLLSMTATPIPRSLALTIFGDFDCSFLDEVPTGRKATITRVIEPTQRDPAYTLIARELTAGRQAYVVCPTIDPATDTARLDFEADHRAATKRHETLQTDQRFRQFEVGLLHGQLKASEKQAIMERFARGEIHILVATSLIEVGIDVPNATVLVIEGADHFGLAQLHQLRGRVGRGEKQSLCVAIAEDWSPVARERLRAFEQSTNGFELAELDLKLRGPGDLLGELQAGLPPLKLANLTDTVMIERARLLATELRHRCAIDRSLAATVERALGLEGEHGGVAELH